MSYLSRPAFHFIGGAYSNPSTADNNDFADLFDVDTLEFKPTITPIPGATVVDPTNEQQVTYGGAQDAATVRQWLMGLMTGLPADEGGPYGQQAHFNYYGDHATRLEHAAIRTIWARPGVTVPPSDPMYGATVQIVGNSFGGLQTDPVIVDVDPYALVTSQIFSTGIRVVAADGTTVLIDAEQENRAFSYFLNPYKNVDPTAIGFQMVSGVFICSIQKGTGLRINPSGVDSPALADLMSAVEEGAGLNMRYCFYDAIYTTDPEELYQNFAKGIFSANPYVGHAIGTLGVAQPGDLLSAPMGRKLVVQTRFSTTGATCGGQAVTGRDITLGVALANVDTSNQVVTLDLVSTFPECNVNTNEKLALGAMQLAIVPTAGPSIPIGPIPNDRQTYESGGGLVEVSYASSPNRARIEQNLETGTLSIEGGLTPWQTLLAEVPGIDIQTDDRALYLQETTPGPNGGPAVPGTASLTIRVFEKGVPAQNPTTVNLEYWTCQKDYINPSKPQVPVPQQTTPPQPNLGRYFTIADAVAVPNTTYYLPYYGGGPRTVEVMTDQVTVPAGGVLTLQLSALRPGVSEIRFVDAAAAPTMPNFAWDNVFYAVVRILPTDDFSGYSDEQINNWPFIYANVFCYFSVLYPIMSTFIPWGPDEAPRDPEKVKAFANNILQMTDPAFWNSTLYMPITRELSAGKRTLLARWCALNS